MALKGQAPRTDAKPIFLTTAGGLGRSRHRRSSSGSSKVLTLPLTRCLGCIVLLLVGCVWVRPIAAEQGTDETREAGRWVPALSASSGASVVPQRDATVDSTARGRFAGDARSVFPYVGLSAELMTPALAASAGRPRLFLHGDAALSFDSEQNIVQDGVPGALEIPVLDPDGPGPAPPRVDIPLGAIRGVGSATQAEVEPWVFSAGVGIAFSLEARGRTLRFKPSLEYRHEQTKLTTLVSAAESIADTGVCPCRTGELSARKQESYHGIGPGLEVELDAARTGPFMLTVFISGQAYRTLSDRTIRLHAEGSFDDGKPLAVESTVTRDPWSFRGGVGLRFRWLPE